MTNQQPQPDPADEVERRLAEMRVLHADCNNAAGPFCEAAWLLALVEQLREDGARLNGGLLIGTGRTAREAIDAARKEQR